MRIPDTFSLPNRLYEQYTRYVRKKLDRANTLAARHISAISCFGRECMIQNYDVYPAVCYIGVDEMVFKPTAKKRKKQVFFVADKNAFCGYDYAIEALKRIPAAIRPELKVIEWTKDNKKRLSDQELAKQYSESLLTFSFNKFDTFGLVPLESMACGTPVIAFNVAGYRETIKHGETGYVVEFDVQAITDAVMLLLKDEQKLEAMGKAGRKWIEEKWTWDIQINHLEQLLKKLSNQHA